MPLGLLGGGTKYFLLGVGYFCVDEKDDAPLDNEQPILDKIVDDVFNLTICNKAKISRPTLGIMPSITYMYNQSCTPLHSRIEVGRN